MKKILIVIIVIAVLGFAYYAISPLFNTKVVNDPLPSTPLTEEQKMAQTEGGFEDLSEEDQEAMTEQMETLAELDPTEVQDVMLNLGGGPSAVEVMSTVGHPAEGTARVVDINDGRIVRFENFKTINGPRLHVYLAKDLRATEFIDLGPIRGTEGNINYEIPPGTDLNEYKYVMHWCVPFGVLFNFADISG